MRVKLYEKYTLLKNNSDYIIADGENIVAKFLGEDTKVIMENIFPLLSGKYAAEEVAKKLEDVIPLEQTLNVINALHENMLIYYIPDDIEEERNKFVSSLLHSLTPDISFSYGKLSKLTVGIIGSQSNIIDLVKDFMQLGFKLILAYSEKSDEYKVDDCTYTDSLGVLVEQTDFIIAIDSSLLYSNLISQLNHLCLEKRKHWLHCKCLNSIQIMVGPIFTGKKTCYECFVDRLRSNQNDNYDLDIRDKGYEILLQRTQNEFAWTYLKSRIIIETLRFLLELPSGNLVNKVEIIELTDLTKKRYDVLPVPKCVCLGDEYLLYRLWDEDRIYYNKMLYV